MMLSGALEDLDEEVRARIEKGEAFKAQDLTSYRPARSELQRLCFSAVAAGVDSAYALDVAGTSLQEMRALSPAEADRRVPTVEVIGERAASLIAAITAVPFWRRRGRFMHPDLKRRRKELEVLSDY
jgi:hypothetical protein